MASSGIGRFRISTSRSALPRLTAIAAGSAVAFGTLTAVSAPFAQAAPQTTRVQVVKVVTRAPFGKMLATIHGRSLYILPKGSCTGPCVTAWPRLLMPLHTTTPLGTRCLGTVKVGSRLQVTYRGRRLWLFASDSGTSVRGNNVSGFKVAKLITTPCP
ncbi:MAG TPA: hypothetical protein VF834_12980 [Streptosporangiaceae bacterium]